MSLRRLYDLVDGRIRELDADLAKFEATYRQRCGASEKGKGGGVRGSAGGSSARAGGGSFMLPNPADLKIDPNEPTYCLCKRVSFGQMVACENEDCPIEWFHLQCLGLTSPPNGDWFCPHCKQEKEKMQLKQQNAPPES